MNDQEALKWAMWCHLSGLVWIILAPFGLTIPFNLIGPIILWLLKKDEHPFIDAAGKESINFQISLTLYWIVALMILGVLGMLSLIISRVGADPDQRSGFLVGGFGAWSMGVTILFAIFALSLAIAAAVKANKGEFYRYPLTIRIFK